MAGTDLNLGRQNTVYAPFFTAYTGGAATPTTVALGYLSSDGVNGSLYWDLWEGNVAAGGAIIIEGTDDPVNIAWAPVGYYTIVSNGTTQDTLTRAHAAVTLTQNTLTRLQMLDAYRYMRARVTANASSASLNATMYGTPN